MVNTFKYLNPFALEDCAQSTKEKKKTNFQFDEKTTERKINKNAWSDLSAKIPVQRTCDHYNCDEGIRRSGKVMKKIESLLQHERNCYTNEL